MTLAPQGLAPLFVVGKRTRHPTPEAPRMIGFAQMRKLVYYNIVDQVWRHLNQFPVEVDTPIGVAGAPACFSIGQPDSGHLHADHGCKVGSALLEPGLRVGAQPRDDMLSQPVWIGCVSGDVKPVAVTLSCAALRIRREHQWLAQHHHLRVCLPYERRSPTSPPRSHLSLH